MNITSLTTLYIFAMTIMLGLTVIKMLDYSKEEDKSKKYVSILFIIWIALDFTLLGANNVLLPVGISELGLFAIILIGVAAAGLLLSPAFKTLIALPQQFLLLPQAFRMFFGLGFMIEAAYNIIPLEFGVIDSIFHVTAAFLASMLAIYIAHGVKSNRALILVNLFGLLDIVVVATGISFFVLSDLGVAHNIYNVVFFAAPIFIWFHFVSLYKVYMERNASKGDMNK